jgi:hypothetical protein
LTVSVVADGHGESAVAAVSGATWIVTRPRRDYVPRAARIVTVSVGVGGVRSSPVTFASPRSIRVIVGLINRSPVIQPAFTSCFFSFTTDTYRLVFRARAGGPALARAQAVVSGCSDLELSVGGREGPFLTDGWGLANLLLRTGGVGPCASKDLALEATGTSNGHGHYQADFKLVDRGKRPCAVNGQRAVTLQGTNHQPLAIPLNFGPPHRRHWLIDSQYPALVSLSWIHTCPDNRAAYLHIAIGSQPALTAPVGEDQPLDPCRASFSLLPQAS